MTNEFEAENTKILVARIDATRLHITGCVMKGDLIADIDTTIGPDDSWWDRAVRALEDQAAGKPGPAKFDVMP